MTRAEVDALLAGQVPAPDPEKFRAEREGNWTPDPHPRAVLAVRVRDADSPGDTVRDVLVQRLREAYLCESEGWKDALYAALAEADLIDAHHPEAHADRLIKSAIDALGRG